MTAPEELGVLLIETEPDQDTVALLDADKLLESEAVRADDGDTVTLTDIDPLRD